MASIFLSKNVLFGMWRSIFAETVVCLMVFIFPRDIRIKTLSLLFISFLLTKR